MNALAAGSWTPGITEALAFIDAQRHDHRLCLIALDQPSIVPNASGARSAERVAGSVISFIGGGVQPANRGKAAMFGDDAPIWRFLEAVDARQDPMAVTHAEAGRFLTKCSPPLRCLGLSQPLLAVSGRRNIIPEIAGDFGRRIGGRSRMWWHKLRRGSISQRWFIGPKQWRRLRRREKPIRIASMPRFARW
ncbi:hypothetical protein [Rhodovulum sulfidophilum]|uniref:hypothetical protein n=1 Tax=Rhodovulum sulfidophilum TaxID=35806 RepID=UPI001F1E0D15|nr:hypothetical protein [Rhodovulum sulfidophilum]